MIRTIMEVPPYVQKWAHHNGYDHVIQLSIQRDTFGRKKYGTPLTIENDRTGHVKDALEEIGDFYHYLMAAKLRGEDIMTLKPYIDALTHLFEELSHSDTHTTHHSK